MSAFSSDFEAALVLAAQAHSSQYRKGTKIPYIVHPVHVAAILGRYGFPDHVLVAALLHDVVEDGNVSLESIEEDFGLSVAAIVGTLTERKRDASGPIRWEERRAEALERLKSSDVEAAVVKAADTLHNAATIAIELNKHGISVWQRFDRGAEQILGNYKDILSVLQAILDDHPLIGELDAAIHTLELLTWA